jgi:branched-chain amino acid transport system substrate-binding protein
VMIEGLKRAGKDVNRDKLRTALASIRNMEIGELKIGFSNAAPYVGTLPVRMGVFGPDLTVRV